MKGHLGNGIKGRNSGVEGSPQDTFESHYGFPRGKRFGRCPWLECIRTL